MFFTDSVYIGIDLNSGHKALTYATLDHDLNLVALADAEWEETFAFIAGQKSAVVAINAPSHVNHGIARKNLQGQSLASRSLHGREMRVAEYELRQRGIAVKGTDAKESLCPAGVRADSLSIKNYPSSDSKHIPVIMLRVNGWRLIPMHASAF